MMSLYSAVHIKSNSDIFLLFKSRVLNPRLLPVVPRFATNRNTSVQKADNGSIRPFINMPLSFPAGTKSIFLSVQAYMIFTAILLLRAQLPTSVTFFFVI